MQPTDITLEQILPICSTSDDERISLVIDTKNYTTRMCLCRKEIRDLLSSAILGSRVSLIQANSNEMLELTVKTE